jgi:leucyl-tRNA synthetase
MTLEDDERALRRVTHQTIKRVTGDVDPRMHLNTAISAMMELVNELYAFGEKRGIRPSGRDDDPPATIERRETAAVVREVVESLVLLLAPFAPHLAEDLWERLGHSGSLVATSWPAWDDAVAAEDEVEIPVQVNGKVRGRVTVPASAADSAIEAAALGSPQIQPHLSGRTVVKVIVARGRLVSIVVK